MKTKWQKIKIESTLQNIPKIGSLLRSDYLDEGKFPVIDQGQEFIAGFTNDNSLIFNDCLPVIIFGDHTRALKFIDFPFAVGADGTKILKPTDDFDPMFFFYMLQSLDLGSRGYARHFKLLKEKEIPLPSIKTQKEIVAKLDEKFAKLKEAKKLQEEALAHTEKILSQTLREIFEEGKQNGWQDKTIGETCELVARGISPKYTDSTGITILNQKCIRDHLINYSYSRLHDETKKFSSEKLIQVGDVLVNSTGVGTLGRVAQVKTIVSKTLVDSHVTIVRPMKNVFNLNYFGWMMIFVEDLIKEMGTGSSGQTELSRIALQKIVVSYPKSISEQEKTVANLDSLSEKVKTLRGLQTSQLEDFNRLEKAYLREAFSGELH